MPQSGRLLTVLLIDTTHTTGARREPVYRLHSDGAGLWLHLQAPNGHSKEPRPIGSAVRVRLLPVVPLVPSSSFRVGLSIFLAEHTAPSQFPSAALRMYKNLAAIFSLRYLHQQTRGFRKSSSNPPPPPLRWGRGGWELGGIRNV